MKRISLLLFLWINSSLLFAQPYEKAPRLPKSVHRITEWVRPSLKTKSVKGMVSEFDRKGNLLSYTSQDSTILNTRHILNAKGQVLERREGEGPNAILTRFSYQADRMIEESSFRGKQNRVIYFYNKKRQVVERKTYSRGLELGDAYLLRERILFQYNKSGQCINEQIRSYSLNRPNQYETRKKIYHYHSDKQHLQKVIYYDVDGSPSAVEDYAYYDDGKLKSLIRSFLKNQVIETEEYLYQNGKLWQRITNEMGSRHVEVFAKGRLVRLRSYHGDQLYRVVDYQYDFY